ncbi:MAG TPA: fibronectin type III domain-containing protein [Candidatus Angelobacter sp.]|nr:fibronectin type III domain-containing protein [Candidatus Angelobacter sp.]
MRSDSRTAHYELANQELRFSVQIVLVCLALIFAFAASAHAQNVTVLNTPTTTTLWAGTQDWSTFGLSSVTNATSGLILEGTAISQFTGKPVRHMWYGDASNGLCRVDPEVDDPTVSTIPGIGFHNNIERTCVGFIQAGGFAPQQLTYDASTRTIYAADIPRTANGVIRLHYIPGGDNGQGSIDPIHVDSLMGAQATRNAAGGCPVVTDPRNGATPFTMSSASVGPDGNLYIGWMRNGTIARIPHPATFDPSNPADCASIDVPIFAADARLGAGGAAGHTFGLAWIGHTLFGADNISPWFKDNADQCLTPANGNVRCGPVAGAGTEILGAFAPGPQAGIVSDFIYDGPDTTFPGNTLYALTLGAAVRVSNATDVQNISVTPQFGGAFCFITGLTIDTSNLANETVYIGSDCTQGAINGAGAIWQVTPQAPAAGPPAVPVGVRATATANAATVSWIPTPNGQSISNFVVRTLLANGSPSTVADFTVNPATNGIPPTTATISGLTNGTALEFVVQACNASGCSPFSAPSSVVTPQALTVPGAPTGVVASPGNKSATIAWTAPANNGGSPIISYTITATPGGLTVTVPASQTGLNFTGLSTGTTYSFTVHATNSTGNSLESLPSNAVTIIAQQAVDLGITMTSPTAVNAGAFVTFTMTVVNNGPGDAALVTLTDTLPGTFQSSSTTQGVCTNAATVFTCNLGGLTAGSQAIVRVTVVAGTSAITNTASVQLRDASGNLLNETVAGNNLASSTTNVNPLAGGGGAVGGGGGGGGNSGGADIQVTGSARNGGPNVGTGDTYVWQIKDNTGNTPAANVVFTLALPANMQFLDATASQGSCSGVTSGSTGGTLTCNLASLPGGQTLVVTVDFVPLQAGSISATGSASFGGTDSNPSNNSFTVTIQPR